MVHLYYVTDVTIPHLVDEATTARCHY